MKAVVCKKAYIRCPYIVNLSRYFFFYEPILPYIPLSQNRCMFPENNGQKYSVKIRDYQFLNINHFIMKTQSHEQLKRI